MSLSPAEIKAIAAELFRLQRAQEEQRLDMEVLCSGDVDAIKKRQHDKMFRKGTA